MYISTDPLLSTNLHNIQKCSVSCHFLKPLSVKVKGMLHFGSNKEMLQNILKKQIDTLLSRLVGHK